MKLKLKNVHAFTMVLKPKKMAKFIDKMAKKGYEPFGSPTDQVGGKVSQVFGRKVNGEV